MQVMMTFDESASLLGITRVSLERWLRSGRIAPPSQENVGGRRFFALSDIEAWLAANPRYAARSRSKLSDSARAELIATATKRTQDQREVRKAARAKEAREATRQEAKAAKQRAHVAPEPATADAELETAAPVDPILSLAHSPRRQGRHVRNRTLPPADAFTNVDLDRKLGGGSALPKLRWHL